MSTYRDDPRVSTVNETPDMDCCTTASSPGSFSRSGNSNSTIIHTSEFAKQLTCCSISSTNPSEDTTGDHCSTVVTPERNVPAGKAPDKESSLNVSVNSHFQKRRKSIAKEQLDANCRIEFGFEVNCAGREFKSSSMTLLPISNSNASCEHAVDKRLQIACLLCRSPLGLPENHLYVTCSLTTSSKVYLANLLREKLGPPAINTIGIRIVMADVSSVDQRLCNGTHEGTQGQGIWCEVDGCVFSNIFCPFCSNPNNCLGALIKATDSSNVQLLNKMLFFSDLLEIKNLEASNDKMSSDKNLNASNNKESSNKDLSPVCTLSMDKTAAFSSIDKFAFSPQERSGGWRTTKSKLRLPKRALLSDAEV